MIESLIGAGRTPAFYLLRRVIVKYLPKLFLYALVSILPLLPAAAGAGDTDSPGGGTVEVSIKLFSFNPKVLEVPAGTTVVWTNGDAIEHSVTSGVPGNPSGAFDSGFFTEGQTWSHTFTEPGEYPYFCRRHESMTGMVKVTPN